MTRNRDELLVLNNETVNDRGWKYEFFFANKKSLGPAADKLLEGGMLKVNFSPTSQFYLFSHHIV